MENVEQKEVKRLRNGIVLDTLASVDIQEIARIGRSVIEIFEGVLYQEKFKAPPFGSFVKKLFLLRKQYKKGNII